MTSIPRIRHLHFDDVESTMEAARAETEASPGEFLLVTAERQRAGRGTRGRPWHSPRGNVYLTLAVPRIHLSQDRLRLFPLEAGLALWEAAATFVAPSSRERLRLKWPNDLLWEGRKAAGMLLEASGEHVFTGIGINIAEAPDVTDGGTPSARLVDAGIPEEAGLEMAKAFAGTLRDRLSAPGAHDTLSLWRARALWNRPFRLRDRAGAPEVLPVDVGDDGRLLVRHAEGREEWLAAEYLA
jgi:BirA family transcriptional regulator, biotin operon repressor / biotin---[acetyl-CoA-carboxylase] ligase